MILRTRRGLRQALLVSLPLALALGACGGGGSSGSATPTPPVAAKAADTSIATAVAPAALPSNFRAMGPIPLNLVESAVAQLPADTGPTYLKVWFDDPATGEVALLALVRWTAGSPLPQVQPPVTVTVVKFEVYNAKGSVEGQWKVA